MSLNTAKRLQQIERQPHTLPYTPMYSSKRSLWKNKYQLSIPNQQQSLIDTDMMLPNLDLRIQKMSLNHLIFNIDQSDRTFVKINMDKTFRLQEIDRISADSLVFAIYVLKTFTAFLNRTFPAIRNWKSPQTAWDKCESNKSSANGCNLLLFFMTWWPILNTDYNDGNNGVQIPESTSIKISISHK